MDEDSLLPPPPQVEPRGKKIPALVRLGSSNGSRKRLYELEDDDAISSLVHTSSDPALFSSDENPDVENYLGSKRRKKRTYAGTWWGEKQKMNGSASDTSSRGIVERVKRKFTRNFDSGVFMASDDSASADLSSDSSFTADFLNDQKVTQRSRNTITPDTSFTSLSPSTPVQKKNVRVPITSPSSPYKTKKPLTEQEKRDEEVRLKIRECLELGKEDIDLSDRLLDHLPAEIHELNTTVIPGDLESGYYNKLEARHRLYLSRNLFRQFPMQVLGLHNLRLLSLRQNKLSSIPQSISKLTKLRTLNISGNRFQTMPIEILHLMMKHDLRELHSDPNPWLQIPEQRRQAPLTPSKQQNCTSTGNDGTAPSWSKFNCIASNRQQHGSVMPSIAKYPSLTEIVLRQLYKSNICESDITTLMPSDTPQRVARHLAKLYEAQIDGGRFCSLCHRTIVQPADTWIEWWAEAPPKAEPETSHLPAVGSDELSVMTPRRVLPFQVMWCGSCDDASITT